VASYKVLVGLDYGNPSKRVEAGDVVSDLPAKSIGWLSEQLIIELVDEVAPTKSVKKESLKEPLAEVKGEVA